MRIALILALPTVLLCGLVSRIAFAQDEAREKRLMARIAQLEAGVKKWEAELEPVLGREVLSMLVNDVHAQKEAVAELKKIQPALSMDAARKAVDDPGFQFDLSIPVVDSEGITNERMRTRVKSKVLDYDLAEKSLQEHKVDAELRKKLIALEEAAAALLDAEMRLADPTKPENPPTAPPTTGPTTQPR